MKKKDYIKSLNTKYIEFFCLLAVISFSFTQSSLHYTFHSTHLELIRVKTVFQDLQAKSVCKVRLNPP